MNSRKNEDTIGVDVEAFDVLVLLGLAVPDEVVKEPDEDVEEAVVTNGEDDVESCRGPYCEGSATTMLSRSEFK